MSIAEVIENEQQVPWFGTPLNFTQTVKMRRLRRELGRDRAAELNGWYAHMRDLAKQGREFATFSTDVEAFVDSYGGLVPDRDDAIYGAWFERCALTWDAFEGFRLIYIDGEVRDLEHTFRVTVVDYDETNTRRTSGSSARPKRTRTEQDEADRRARDAARKRKERADKKAQLAGVVPIVQQASEDASASSREGEERTGEDRKENHHPPSGGADVHQLPPGPRTVAGQIQRARHDLGSLTTFVITMIGLRTSDAGRMLTEMQELNEYWRPACELLSEHGPDRLRRAFGEAAQHNPTRIGYVATIAGRLQREQLEAGAADPDLASSEFAGITGQSTSAPEGGL